MRGRCSGKRTYCCNSIAGCYSPVLGGTSGWISSSSGCRCLCAWPTPGPAHRKGDLVYLTWSTACRCWCASGRSGFILRFVVGIRFLWSTEMIAGRIWECCSSVYLPVYWDLAEPSAPPAAAKSSSWDPAADGWTARIAGSVRLAPFPPAIGWGSGCLWFLNLLPNQDWRAYRGGSGRNWRTPVASVAWFCFQILCY